MVQQYSDQPRDTISRLDRVAFPIFTLALLVLLALAYGVPSSAWYPAHDWLDSNLVIYGLWGEARDLFNLEAELEPLLGGIPLSALALSDLDPKLHLYTLFEPLTAAAINEAVSRVIAYLGLYLLLTRYLIRHHPWRRLIAVGPAALFALLPYWPQMSFTIGMQPLLAYAMANLAAGRSRATSWSVVCMYPLVAGLVGGGFAVVGACIIAVIVALARRHPGAKSLLAATVTIIGLFLVTEFRAFHLVLVSEFTSHRTDWGSPSSAWFAPANLAKVPAELWEVVTQGQYHMASGQWGVPLIAVALAAMVLAGQQVAPRVRAASDVSPRLMQDRIVVFWFVALSAIILLGIIYATERTATTQFGHMFDVRIQFNRVIALYPALWMIVLALSMAVVSRRGRAGMGVLVAILSLLALGQGVWSSHSVLPRLSPYIGEVGDYRFPRHQTGAYYREEQYQEISQELDRLPSDTTVISLGIDPMIAAFNGYNTLDGYVWNYPLEHKHAFREIIAGELEKLPERRSYYDGWGSRVYLFHEDRPSGELHLDFCAAQEMGADYVLSRREIPADMGLTEVATSGDLMAYDLDRACEP